MKNENMEQVMKAREHDVTDATEEPIKDTYKAIEHGVVDTYKKIETGVVEGYKKMESSIVSAANKVTDKCVEVLFAKEGESVEDAKKRLSGRE